MVARAAAGRHARSTAACRWSAGPCDDWRGALKAGFATPRRIALRRQLPRGLRRAALAGGRPEPATYNARLIEALWREMGGQLRGTRARRHRAGRPPPSFELASPPLAEVVRDINKFSNNVMAQQLFLTLALQAAPRQPATPDGARATVLRAAGLAGARCGEPPAAGELVIDNGSGLSRERAHQRRSCWRGCCSRPGTAR